jgi:hypothetical protein
VQLGANTYKEPGRAYHLLHISIVAVSAQRYLPRIGGEILDSGNRAVMLHRGRLTSTTVRIITTMSNHRSIFTAPGLAFILIMMAGCGSKSPTAPTSSNNVMDLKVGNRWVYRTATYDDNGNEDGATFDTTTIVRTMSAAGITWYVTNNGPMYANRSDGAWEWSADTSSGAPRLYVPYPVRLDQSFAEAAYQTTDPTGAPDDTVYFSYVITSTNTQVATHAGAFTCFQYASRYRSTKGALTTEQFGFDGDEVNSVMPGLGPVAGESYGFTNDGRKVLKMRWELYAK